MRIPCEAGHLTIETKTEIELAKLDGFVVQMRDVAEQLYEGCMYARVREAKDGTATLVIRFLPESSLDRLPIHRHGHSSRKVAIVGGKGTFHFKNPVSGAIEKVDVTRGMEVSFPAGLFHTFTTEQSEMLVVAVHDPFQELDDPEILEYESA